MNTDMQRFCDELRAKISIVDVVGAKVKLVRKGREYQACCPFHNEKTPSFTVNEAKGFYHCFGCGAHGDIIRFEMEGNGLTFIEAVEKLAHKVGMQVPRLSAESREEQEKRATAYDIMELAAKYFERILRLPEGREGLDYLYARGFGNDIISKFRLGFAPTNNGLKALLSSKGIEEKEMAQLGLLTIPEDGRRSHDFFRGRVMIPIMDKRGKVIAFGGRVMDKSQPKYLNSPETPIFNKRRVLYNLNYARDLAYDAKRLIICEGYMDVIAMSKYGVGYAVAPLGTALTEDQIQEAWKAVPEPICCFDGDAAGIRAAVRSVDRVLPLLKPGYSLQYAFLPDKMDPDEFLKAKGRDEFIKTVSETVPLKDLLWRKTLEGKSVDTPEQKALVEQELKTEIAKIQDEVVRGYYAREMKGKIYAEFRERPWMKETRELAGRNGGNYNKDKLKTKSLISSVKTDLDDLVVKYMISAFICYPRLAEEWEEKIPDLLIKDERLRHLYATVMTIVRDREDISDEAQMIAALEEAGVKDWSELADLRILKKQCPDMIKMRSSLLKRMTEVQLMKLESDIREARAKLETEDFSAEDYERYQALRKEKDALLQAEGED
ncbi:MAG: DNA primase [Alphaproteobacteria bacterium]|nr:DNA primase [Alphaproteobacteria bacterium]MBQ9235078.1 DNA primase [Alphaproteobacteria bacterium]